MPTTMMPKPPHLHQPPLPPTTITTLRPTTTVRSITTARLRQITHELAHLRSFLCFTESASTELRGRLAIAQRGETKELWLLSASASGATRRRNFGGSVDIEVSVVQDGEMLEGLRKAVLEKRLEMVRLKVERRVLEE